MIDIFYSHIDSDYGKIWILATDRGLFSIYLRNIDEAKLIETISVDSDNMLFAKRDDERLMQVAEQIKKYLKGKPQKFDFEFDLAGATKFQLEVWETIRKIPFGETRTYGWVAREIGNPKAYRAVGNALGANPLPIIIPCHRIVATKGLGGFTGGMEWKKTLLKIEGYETD